MAKKTFNNLKDLQVVYSTNPGYTPEELTKSTESSIDKNQMVVRVQLNSKLKGGKSATVIKGLELSDDELNVLCRMIKQKCGVGGSVKTGEIIIQGDQVNKLVDYLKASGYKNTKRSGG